jgi:hypothetical protein
VDACLRIASAREKLRSGHFAPIRSFEGLPCVLGFTQLRDNSQSASSTDASLVCYGHSFQFYRNIEMGSVFSYLR